MRAIIVDRSGGPEVLRYAEAPDPVPGQGELLIETSGIGVNFIETYQRSGAYAVEHPFIPGAEATGRVVALGEGVSGVAIGDRVLTAEAVGSYAERCTVAADAAVRIPDHLAEVLTDERAAALPLQGLTAHYLATSLAAPVAGETVLLHAGAGGVGLLLTQILAARGVRVLTTASSEEKRKLSLAAGAAESFDYDGFADRARDLTGGEGVAVVYDGVGKDTFDDSLRALRVRGEAVLFGAASGPVPPFDLQRLNAGGALSVTRPSLLHFLRSAEERAWRYGELFDALAAGTLDVRVGATFPLAEAGAAHTALEGRATTGKVVLVP